MQRREFLGSAAILGAAAMTGTLGATAAHAAGEKGSAGLMVTNTATLELMAKVREAAFQCNNKASLCEEHCAEQLANANAMFVRCNTTVRQMHAVCEAVGKLASLKSVHLGAMLGACVAACKSCKEACEEHKEHWAHGMHMECKDCAEACSSLVIAANALQAGWKVS